MKMKLTRIVYIHETFHLPENSGLTDTGNKGVSKNY